MRIGFQLRGHRLGPKGTSLGILWGILRTNFLASMAFCWKSSWTGRWGCRSASRSTLIASTAAESLLVTKKKSMIEADFF
eukprot:9825063-Heterocapsa_arctica.AAC.1